MKTRLIGQITHNALGVQQLLWSWEPTGYSEDCHIQVTQSTGDSTFNSQVFASLEPLRLIDSPETGVVGGDTLHQIVNLPYLKLAVDVTIAPASWPAIFDVWVAE